MTTKTEPQHATVWAAFAAAQAEFKAPAQSGRNPAYKSPRHKDGSPYSTLGDIFSAIMPALHKHGLGFAQLPITHPDGNLVLLTEVFLAATGQSIESTLPLPHNMRPQEFGSLLSYYKRYAAAAMFAVVDGMDDDAEAATAPQRAQTPQRTAKPTNGAQAPVSDAQAPNDEPVMPDETVSRSVWTNYHELGTALHGDEWDNVRHEQTRVISNGSAESSKELTMAQLKRLTAGMAAKLAQKNQPDAALSDNEDIPF